MSDKMEPDRTFLLKVGWPKCSLKCLIFVSVDSVVFSLLPRFGGACICAQHTHTQDPSTRALTQAAYPAPGVTQPLPMGALLSLPWG